MTEKRPRILLITRNLPPLVGGMERLNWHMADELAKWAEVRVIGPSASAVLKPRSVTLIGAPLKPLPLFLLTSALKGFWLALRWKPNVVLAGSGLTAPIAWLLGKLCGARTAAYLHGLDITVNHTLYRKLWRPTFRKLDRVIVNSTSSQQLALAAGVNPNTISIIHPGVRLPETPQPAENIAAFKERHDLNGKKILLSVGRLTTRKGLREFVEHALPDIVQAIPSAMLVVIGEAPKNSLGADIQSVESIQAQALKSGVGGHIKFLGVVTDSSLLATAYEAADVHVFPVRHIPDDPEGFGMVATEAAAHGVPTVAFATGGISDAVSEGQSGHLVPAGDYAALTQAVIKTLEVPRTEWQPKAAAFSRQFSWQNFGQRIGAALLVDPQ